MSCQSAPEFLHTISPSILDRCWRCDSAGPGSVGGPMRCPWYLFHRLF
ncbi:unnamed protein product [Staurois parvus]|uniref:Uncharacterized protein n=1 Tax=Staurois parvus TaxID=386267 RepID=A0ABN9FT42_9NEOB|nr:unnamed protein product [Staurois parvus]